MSLQAENLYLKGAELERNNNYYDAIRYYRKAFQLVPDIETKVLKNSGFKDGNKFNEDNKGSITLVNCHRTNGSNKYGNHSFTISENQYIQHETDENSDEEDVYDGSEPLEARFNRLVGKFSRICVPDKPQKVFDFTNN